MDIVYNRRSFDLYEKRARAGKTLAYRAELAGDKSRRAGKTLKVISFPQGGERVPSVRVAGKWLERIGFRPGDEVTLIATKDQIIITKKEVSGYDSSLV